MRLMRLVFKESEPGDNRPSNEDRRAWQQITSPKGTDLPGVRYVECEGWTPVRVVTRGGLILREPIPVTELTQVDFKKTGWEDYILESAHLLSRGFGIGILKDGPNHELEPLEGFMGGGNMAKNTLAKLHSINARLVRSEFGFDGPEEVEIRREKGDLLKKISEGFKRTQNFRPISEMMDILCGASVDASEEASNTISMLNVDVRALLLLAGNEHKLLIGTKDRIPTWQKFQPPPLYKDIPAPILHLTTPGIFYLEYIGEREKPAFPEKMVYPGDLARLRFPEVPGTVEGFLEEIFYRQKYIMNEGGIDLELKGAGDAMGMVLVESHGILFANTRTPYGGLFTAIFLDKAFGMSAESGNEYTVGLKTPREIFSDSRLAALVAAQYRDLLCGKEVVRSRGRGKTSEADPGRTDGAPRVSSIRTIRNEVRKDPVRKYEGDPRPVKPHQVAGHLRRAGLNGLSDGQIEAVRNYIKTTGLRVPRPEPGQTIVLPYYVPSESGKVIKGMPTFMRAKFQETSFKDFEGVSDNQAGYIGPDNVDEIYPPKG